MCQAQFWKIQQISQADHLNAYNQCKGEKKLVCVFKSLEFGYLSYVNHKHTSLVTGQLFNIKK